MSRLPPLTIPQTDPKAGYLAHRREIDAAVGRVLAGGWYILGQEVAAFEAEFAAYIGVKHAIGVANGTDALELALRGCGVGPGDAVFTVSHTAVATVAAIERCGADPVLVDINPDTFTLDPESFEDGLRQHSGGRAAAVVAVHLYGQPANMPAILDIAQRYGLHVIEDCAQSHGATIDDCMTGSLGDVAAFSFYPTKNLGALGDGGAVATNDAAIAERVQMLRQYGWRTRYVSEIPGFNSRLDEVQAAILRIKLHYLDRENERRRTIAHTYTQQLSDMSLILPTCHLKANHVYHQYVIRCKQRDELRTYLRNQGIGTLIHYPLAVHQQPAYSARLAGNSSHLDKSEKIVTQILSLPIHPELSNDQLAHITEAISRWGENG